MNGLPSESFKLKKVVIAIVQRNYHIQLSENHHYYSVPYTYAGKKVKVLYDEQMVEIYSEGERIAVHQRNNLSKAYHTIQGICLPIIDTPTSERLEPGRFIKTG